MQVASLKENARGLFLNYLSSTAFEKTYYLKSFDCALLSLEFGSNCRLHPSFADCFE